MNAYRERHRNNFQDHTKPPAPSKYKLLGMISRMYYNKHISQLKHKNKP